LSREEQIAANLEEYVLLYCEAVVQRRLSLAAADRFYRDLMVYQWRLNALEVQTRTVVAAIRNEAEAGSDISAAVDECMIELEEQHMQAVSAFEERASHYALGAPTKSTGHIKRFAATEAERQLALDHYRRLAKDTFHDVMSEARLIGLVPQDNDLLCKLQRGLQGQSSFWQMQLEETWEAWHSVTAQMHLTGEDAMSAWKGVIANLEEVQECLQKPDPDEALTEALAAFAARGLEVELVNSLGLTGLTADIAGDEYTHDVFSQEARLRSLTSVFELLQTTGFLHEVGEALAETLDELGSTTGVAEEFGLGNYSMATPHAEKALQLAGQGSKRDMMGRRQSSDAVLTLTSKKSLHYSPSRSVESSHSSPAIGTPVASAALQLAAAARLTPTAGVRLANEDPEDEGVACLIPWLTKSLVEATREAVDCCHGAQVIKLLRLCRSLGNEKLAGAVYAAATKHSEKRRSFWQNLAHDEGEEVTNELRSLLKLLSEIADAKDFGEDNPTPHLEAQPFQHLLCRASLE
jgi:hypothetical protein